MRHVIVILFSLLGLLGPIPAASAEAVVRVGILSFRPPEITRRQWAALPPLLENALPGTRVELVVLGYPEFDAEARAGRLDFMLTNPEYFVLLRNRYGASALATLARQEGGRVLAELSGVIFTRADRRDIETLDDLSGKTVAAVSEEALGGYMLGAWELGKRGIEVHYSFTGQPHDNVVTRVLERRADAGFVRSGVLEVQAAEGKLRLDAASPIKVLNQQSGDGFPQLYSTVRVPEFPFAAARHVAPEMARVVLRALLAIEPSDTLARQAQIAGFYPPADYTPVELLMLRLRAHPEVLKQFTLTDVMFRYRMPLLAVAFLLSLNLLLFVLLWRSRQRLRTALAENQRLLATAVDFSLHDALTGLSNRRHLEDRLNLALARARRNGQLGALILLDLDNFKPLNDRHGHALGDQLLCEVARRMREVVRESDTVARFGGDEFVVLASDLGRDATEAREVAGALAEKLRLALAAPYFLTGEYGGRIEHRVTASIGLALFTGDMDPLALIRQTDDAMYAAKHGGRDQVVDVSLTTGQGTEPDTA